MPTSLDRYRRILLWTVIAAFAAVVVGPPLVGMSVDFPSFLIMIMLCLMLAVFWPYAAWRKLTRIQTAIEVAITSFLLAIPLLVFTYMAMRLGFPLMDDNLAAMDAALGYHAPSFVHIVDRSAALSRFFGWCYASFTPQIVLLPVILCAIGNYARGYGMVFGFLVLGALSAVVCVFFPAIGAFAYYGVGSDDLTNISDFFGYQFLDSFHAVREAPDYTLALSSASGIVTFPSVHAAVAVLCGWAAWDSRWLRWPFFILNAGMLISALTHGAHYLVDLFGGVAIAAVSIFAVRALFLSERRAPAAVSGRAAPAASALAH